jgi:NAD(P)-dependent dehydrogenase (short-subunit alcohol dehydrogenase family)
MSKSTYTSTILITGGTTGLGYETALALAKHFPTHQIIIAARSDKDSAATKINTLTKQYNTTFLPLDLSLPSNITTFTSTLTTTYPQITHLLLNAALQFPGPLVHAENGVEKTFQIAHLGHAQLLFQLLPHLSPNLHLTLTASGTHDPAQKSGMPDAIFPSAHAVAFPSPDTANKDGRERYATAKLCNVLFTYALVRHTTPTNTSTSPAKCWKINAFDPGLLPGTGLARNYPPLLNWIWLHIFPRIKPLLRIIYSTDNIHSAAESGANLARLAIGEGEAGVSGKYFEGKKVIKSSEMSYDEGKQEELWRWTVEQLAGGDEGLRAKWERLEG